MKLEDSRIGEILIAMEVITPEQRDIAIARQESGDARQFGSVIRSLNYAQLAQVERALKTQQAIRGKLSHEEHIELLIGIQASMARVGQAFTALESAATTGDLPTIQDDETAKARLLEARATARHLLACVKAKADVEPWVEELIGGWS